jgi:hypothetical protein
VHESGVIDHRHETFELKNRGKRIFHGTSCGAGPATSIESRPPSATPIHDPSLLRDQGRLAHNGRGEAAPYFYNETT